jgi:hypothetical protein
MLFLALQALYLAKASGEPSFHEPSAWIGIPAECYRACVGIRSRFHLKIGHCEIQNRTPGVETALRFVDKLHDGAPQIPCQSALACRAIHQPNRLQREPAPPPYFSIYRGCPSPWSLPQQERAWPYFRFRHCFHLEQRFWHPHRRYDQPVHTSAER